MRGWRAWCKSADSVAKPTPSPSTANATPAMTDDTILPFSFPAVQAKKVTAAFDGGRLTSNGGDGRAASRLGRQFGPGVPGSARPDAGRAQPCRHVPRSHVRDLLRLRGR